MEERDAQVCGSRPTGEILPGLEEGSVVNLIRDQTEVERELFKCKAELVREEIPASVTIDTKGSFQFGINFGNGVVKGHLDKEAHRKGPRYVKP